VTRFIDPVAELGGLLLDVEKPARYTGGEFGILARETSLQKARGTSLQNVKKDACFRTLIAFPDLYEIGMGNQALRIIYNTLNRRHDISCDRAFAPAPDFEKLLREKNIPLYGLDTGISLASLDLLMFTLGYELGLNGLLTMLDVSKIPLHCEDRDQNHPVVIAGGPAISNPLPYSPFVDAFWIGEAEAGFFDLASELALLIKSGEGRAALLKKISSHPNVWVKGKENVKRAIATNFSSGSEAAVFPVPSMKIVQNHGTVEIMRGCPNGCRFCHAGFWYRPMRQKSSNIILEQTRTMVTRGGWREISLSSLSSGDYSGVNNLVEMLNQIFKGRHISFQLPSLRVSGFSLELLEKISVTRKSGLTFAVETARDAWQMAINKEVTRDSTVEILFEAKKRGWKTAKFYFMIGLPLESDGSASCAEEEEIVNFITDIGRRTRMHFNINVGIFVPKPHTPYQCAAQLDSNTAVEKLNFIRAKLKPLGHKVSTADPLTSRIEGLVSRGDESAGLLFEQAFLGGSRLDAWSEYINMDIWRQLLEENKNMIDGFLSPGASIPWQAIDSCVSDRYLRGELEKSDNCKRTDPCNEKCTSCGVCTCGELRIIRNQTGSKKETASDALIRNSIVRKDDHNEFPDLPVNQKNIYVNNKHSSDPAIYRVLFCFSKTGSAVFHGHLSLIEIFSMAFTRADVPVKYTLGFNPLAKIEFASSLATGISSKAEIACADFDTCITGESFVHNLNENLPEGIHIEKADVFFIPGGSKKHSLASLLWGFSYAANEKVDYVRANEDKIYKEKRFFTTPEKQYSKANLFSLMRTGVLAKNLAADTEEWASYFDIYRFLYPK
jgi:radical SAM-linked protein